MLLHADLDLDIPQLFEQLYNFCSVASTPKPRYLFSFAGHLKQTAQTEATQHKCTNIYIY